MKTIQVGCQKVYRSTATLKELQEFPESATMLVVYYLEQQTPIFSIGLEFEVGLQDGLKKKTKQNKNNQAQLQFAKTKLPGKKIKFPESMWEICAKRYVLVLQHQKNTIPMVKHGGGSIILSFQAFYIIRP